MVTFSKDVRVIECESLQLVETNLLYVKKLDDFLWMVDDAARQAKKDGFKEAIVILLKNPTNKSYYLLNEHFISVFQERGVE